MQELRLVLIIVGGLAIAGLLVHGIWTSKKEGKAKFADKPLNKMEPKVHTPLSDDAEEGIISHAKPVKERKEPAFHVEPEDDDPLFGSSDRAFKGNHFSATPDEIEQDDAVDDDMIHSQPQPQVAKSSVAKSQIAQPQVDSAQEKREAQIATEPTPQSMKAAEAKLEEPKNTEAKQNDMEVIVFHVHAAGNSEFVGTELFESMRQNGLIYGAMDIFHRHTDTSGTGKVLFSVANMMNPGTLAHDDPATFTTKGISFFMTLPCFGNPDQNFKLMLRTAQQIADDLGANVLDDKRNLMTPDRLSAYRQQIREFEARNTQAE
ncbi:cell division protein ZipA [Vibrio gangliei]|uniref:cell division protein ZipA n=1 Tax=Vibrio gangliei TaxID=2077090 RepID=UPI000D017AFC|nr:cell division protein ZipA [Vibrio gangliei]